jgi:restriction endonuclease Mrr
VSKLIDNCFSIDVRIDRETLLRDNDHGYKKHAEKKALMELGYEYAKKYANRIEIDTIQCPETGLVSDYVKPHTVMIDSSNMLLYTTYRYTLEKELAKDDK